MTTVTTLVLTAEIMADGRFLITGSGPHGERIDPEALGSTLFAWDEKSFYGTFLEKTEYGLLLSPSEALSFFASPAWLQHMTYELNHAFTSYQEMARVIQQALAAGTISPDFEQWKMGRYGWKMTDAPEGVFGTLPELANTCPGRSTSITR